MTLKVRFNNKDVDREKGGGGIPPAPGTVVRVRNEGPKVKADRGKAPRLTIMLRVDTPGLKPADGNGYVFFEGVTLEGSAREGWEVAENQAWKFDQWLLAFLGRTKQADGQSIDVEKTKGKYAMASVMVDTSPGSRDGLKLSGLMPNEPSRWKKKASDDDEDEDDEDYDDEGPDEDEDEDADDEDEDDGDDSDDDDEDEDDEDEDEDGDDDEDEDEEPAPSPRRSRTASKSTAKKSGSTKAPARSRKKKKPDYDEMELDELKAELEERGKSTKGSRTALISRLRADDDDPFDD